MIDDNRHFLLTVDDAFKEFPEECEMLLERFGYTKEKNMVLWLVPDDMWLAYDGASSDISYCCSDEKWLSHSDLLMCALYYILYERPKKYKINFDLNILYGSKDPLRDLLKLIAEEKLQNEKTKYS